MAGTAVVMGHDLGYGVEWPLLRSLGEPALDSRRKGALNPVALDTWDGATSLLAGYVVSHLFESNNTELKARTRQPRAITQKRSPSKPLLNEPQLYHPGKKRDIGQFCFTGVGLDI